MATNGNYWNELIDKAEKEDTKLGLILNAAQFQGMMNNTVEAIVFYQKANSLISESGKLNDWVALPKLGLALINNEKTQIIESIDLLKQLQTSNSELIDALNNLAHLSESLAIDNHYTIKLYNIVKSFHSKSGDDLQVIYVLHDMSMHYLNNYDLLKAEQLLEEAVQLSLSLDIEAQFLAKNQLAELYFNQKKYNSAENIWRSMINSTANIEDKNYYLSQSYLSLGWNAYAQQELKKSKSYFELAYQVIQQSKDDNTKDDNTIMLKDDLTQVSEFKSNAKTLLT